MREKKGCSSGRVWYWSRMSREERDRPGCMSGMLHFFRLHHLFFTGCCRTPTVVSSPRPEQQQQQKLSHVYQSNEAPSNSLEKTEKTAAVREEYHAVSIAIQIVKTSTEAKKKKMEASVEEEKKVAPAVTPRTRNIVAQLMGLETFNEEATSPTPALLFASTFERERKEFSMKKKKQPQRFRKELKKLSPSMRQPLKNRNCNILGSHSLPDSPRTSSEKPQNTGPRYSLQLNKENNNRATVDFGSIREPSSGRSFSGPPKLRYSTSKKENSEHTEENREQFYTRKVVRHLNGGISKRDGTCLRYGNDEVVSPRKNNAVQSNKSVKLPKTLLRQEQIAYCSSAKAVLFKPTKISRESSPQQRIELQHKVLKLETIKCNKASFERFTKRLNEQHPRQSLTGVIKRSFSDASIRKSSSIEKDQLNSRSSQKLKEKEPEFQYVKAILSQAGIIGANAIKWFSSSHPIDPTIFDDLELGKDVALITTLGQLRHRCNRKLLFHLLEEILIDLRLNEPKRWHGSDRDLLARVWLQIHQSPSVNYRTMDNNDALVAAHLPVSRGRRLLQHPLVVAEVEHIAVGIEWNILDSILREIAVWLAEP
ncbi:hypothetical protein HPP92_022139 [Vanilla planifolia]|uniref:DUF4378 domain-containing protein n=1 Tax=Vanilla planifolia TaxID=51239 RepID=A0A835UCX6_VANPL|nr:hypothetical protein HPP92_022139 [Vanilla planifolia]